MRLTIYIERQKRRIRRAKMKKSRICTDDCRKCPFISCNFHPLFADMTDETRRRELSYVSSSIEVPPKRKFNPRINVFSNEQTLDPEKHPFFW
jgi:hypothetical protein